MSDCEQASCDDFCEQQQPGLWPDATGDALPPTVLTQDNHDPHVIDMGFLS